jgi:hypothetical protein
MGGDTVALGGGQSNVRACTVPNLTTQRLHVCTAICRRGSSAEKYSPVPPVPKNVLAPIWLLPGRIPVQPGAGSHGFATDFILGATVSGRRDPDSDLCTASGGWGIEPVANGITDGVPALWRSWPLHTG